MEKDMVKKNGNAPTEEIVIPDECGDTLWDAVLQQEMKTVSKNGDALLNSINVVQVCDATGVQ